MKGKIIIFSILTVLMIVTISLVSAINTEKDNKKISPLYNIRTNRAINRDKIDFLIEKLKTKFIGNRVFYIPLLFLKEKQQNNQDTVRTLLKVLTCPHYTCVEHCDTVHWPCK